MAGLTQVSRSAQFPIYANAISMPTAPFAYKPLFYPGTNDIQFRLLTKVQLLCDERKYGRFNSGRSGSRCGIAPGRRINFNGYFRTICEVY